MDTCIARLLHPAVQGGYLASAQDRAKTKKECGGGRQGQGNEKAPLRRTQCWGRFHGVNGCMELTLAEGGFTGTKRITASRKPVGVDRQRGRHPLAQAFGLRTEASRSFPAPYRTFLLGLGRFCHFFGKLLSHRLKLGAAGDSPRQRRRWTCC